MKGYNMKAVKEDTVLMLTMEQANKVALTYFDDNCFVYTDDDLPDMTDEFIAENGIVIID